MLLFRVLLVFLPWRICGAGIFEVEILLKRCVGGEDLSILPRHTRAAVWVSVTPFHCARAWGWKAEHVPDRCVVVGIDGNLAGFSGGNERVSLLSSSMTQACCEWFSG